MLLIVALLQLIPAITPQRGRRVVHRIIRRQSAYGGESEQAAVCPKDILSDSLIQKSVSHSRLIEDRPWRRRIVAELGAKAAHEDAEVLEVVFVRGSPDVCEQLTMDGASGVAGEKREKVELLAREFERLPASETSWLARSMRRSLHTLVGDRGIGKRAVRTVFLTVQPAEVCAGPSNRKSYKHVFLIGHKIRSRFIRFDR
jgi:hypothetical protein